MLESGAEIPRGGGGGGAGRESGAAILGHYQNAAAELRSCVKVEVDVLGSPSLIVLMVAADVRQHLKKKKNKRAQELCESRGGCPGLPCP